MVKPQKNMHGFPLKPCSLSPVTGFTRNGYCEHDPYDGGVHTICAEMDREFLNFTKSRGNDLTTVVKPGQNWCICEGRYQEAAKSGAEPRVITNATNRIVSPKIRKWIKTQTNKNT